MAKIKIVQSKDYRLGRFGKSSIDLYRKTPDQNSFIPVTEYDIVSNLIGKGALSPANVSTCSDSGSSAIVGRQSTGSVDDPYNLSEQRKRKTDPRRLPLRIENGLGIPEALCGTTKSIYKEIVKKTKGTDSRNDPFLNEGFEDDYTNEKNDITKTPFFGGGFTANDQLNTVIPVTGIMLEVIPDKAYVQRNFSFQENQKGIVRVVTSFGFDSGSDGSAWTGLCSSAKTIAAPVLVTDLRNSTTNNVGGGFAGASRFVTTWRYYLEIRHGLNTDKYFYTLNANPKVSGSMTVLKKKNSLILSWYLDPNNMKRSDYVGGTEMLPNSKDVDFPNFIDIIFYTDPCDIEQSSLDITVPVE